jgi:hypothetical protein
LRGFLASLFDLCRFQRGPEDMPYAPRLLVALLAGCVAVQSAFELHYGAKPVIVVAVAAGWLAVLGLLRILLRGRGKPERFMQTATALASVTLLFDIVVYPLALLLPLQQILAHQAAAELTLSGAQTLAMFAIAALGVWELCVWVATLRRSLELTLAGAVLMFLLLLIVNRLVAGVFAVAFGGLA